MQNPSKQSTYSSNNASRAFFVVLVATTFGLVTTTLARGSESTIVLSDMDCVVEPSMVVELGTPVAGLMAETFHDVGDFVAAGERVAQLDDQIERLTLSIAEATAADDSAYRLRELAAQLGERTRTRNLNLDENNAISDQAIDQLETEFAAARLSMVQEARALELANIEVKRANALLEQRAIRTPIDGAVVKKYVSSGEYVDGQPVYQIAQLDPLHVEVIAPIEYLDTLTVGMQAGVLLQAPGYSDRRLGASVERIDAVADAASATYGVRLVLDNPDLSIPSGVRCSVEFLSS